MRLPATFIVTTLSDMTSNIIAATVMSHSNPDSNSIKPNEQSQIEIVLFFWEKKKQI